MKHRSRGLLVIAALVLAGCGHSFSPDGVIRIGGFSGVDVQANKTVTLMVRPEFKVSSRRAQALVHTYTRADITALLIRLFQLSGDSEVQVAETQLTPSTLLSTVSFSGLAPNTDYRITSTAYKGTEVISLESSLPVHVGTDDVLEPLTITVKLKDTVFSGRGETNIEIIDGQLIASGDVTIAVDSPPSPSPAPGVSASPDPAATPDASSSPEPAATP